MTTLITTGGERLETRGPYQLTASGRRSLAQNSYPFSGLTGPSSITLLGEGRTISFAQLYRKQPWVAISVNKLTRQVARLPLKVYEEGSGDDRRHVRTGRLPELLREPWPRAAALHLKQKLAFSTLLNGNSVLAKYRPEAAGPPRQFIPLDWRYLAPIREAGGPVEFWETTQSGERRILDAADTVHVAWESPDGEIGVSPLEQLEVTLQSEDASQRYGATSLGSGGRPGGILTGPEGKTIKPEDRAELREQVTSKNPLDGAFSLAILNHGWDLKPWLAHNAVEAELIEQRKLNREEVGAVYDLAGPLIAILDHGTYSNVAELHRNLYVTVLGPWLTLIEDTLQAQLIRGESAFEGQWVEFDLGEVLKGDPRERSVAERNFVQTGIYTINEARKLENLPRIDMDVCDEPLIPTNNVTPGGGRPQGSETEEPQKTIAAHLERAGDRVIRRIKGGGEEGWDRERFERELAQDLDDDLVAKALGGAVETAIDQAAGDPDRLQQFFSALSA